MIEKINIEKLAIEVAKEALTVINSTNNQTTIVSAMVGSSMRTILESVNNKIDEINKEVQSLKDDLNIVKKRNEELQEENAALYAEE